ncbi:hypothetical protein BT67DRAFT_361248, partial [Trichocladium antarcticum]
MVFSDFYKSPRSPLSKFRHSPAQAVPGLSDLDADLVSKDKTKQKEAVKRYLAEKIRNDWDFVWPAVAAPAVPAAAPTELITSEGPSRASEDDPLDPPTPQPAPAATPDEDAPRDPGEEADSESDAGSVYSTISEDALLFRPRIEWTSDLSDDDQPRVSSSPFRFDSPEAVGASVLTSIDSKRTRRRRAVRDEVKWNPGLACFEARRNAWTGAKMARVKPKPPSPVSPSSSRRIFWRHHRTQSSASHGVASGSPPGPTSALHHTTTHSSQHTDTTRASESDSANSAAARTPSHEDAAAPPAALYPVETLIPLPPPLLPPQNPMRASVQPSMYGSLYDKVVAQNMQPSCPVNLADMMRACVVGWKRDGEWPPKSMYAPPTPALGAAAAAAAAAAADMLATRQRKAQHARINQKQADAKRKAAAASAAAAAGGTAASGGGSMKSRRLSFVGFLGENGNGLRPSQSHSHSDEGAGSAGKTLFRRSLQKVLSLGQHHPHPQG